MITSEIDRHCARVRSEVVITWWGLYLLVEVAGEGRLENSRIAEISRFTSVGKDPDCCYIGMPESR